MQLELSDQDLAFRDEMRTFFTTKIPAEIREKNATGQELSKDEVVTTMRILNENGLAVPHWPAEFGGRDWSAVQRHIWLDEMQLASVPEPLAFNASMVGPVIATFGSQEIKEKFLPKTANLDIWWCQGFSEPESGSDLASLKTRAVLKGDEYVVTGQKVWTTFAHHSKWCMLLARTNPDVPKHRGLTYFLMDMEQDGVEVRPLVQITGEAEFNELFIEEARIPVENVVGGVDNGWRVAITTLMHERAGLVVLVAVVRGPAAAQQHPGGRVDVAQQRTQQQPVLRCRHGRRSTLIARRSSIAR